MEEDNLVSSLLLEFQAQNNARLPKAMGHLVHAMFLNLIRQFNIGLSASLHDRSAGRPFTISLLQLPDTQDDYVLLQYNHSYQIRVTLFDQEEILQQLQTYKLETEKIIARLGECQLRLTRILTRPTADPNSWVKNASWKTLYMLPPAQLAKISFVSPTAFSMGERVFKLFPDPKWVWESILRDWNTYAPSRYCMEKCSIQEGIEAAVRVVACGSLTTTILKYPTHQQKGFTGTCTYALLNHQYASYLTTLVAFAFYSGIGSKTTMGMGQALIHLE